MEFPKILLSFSATQNNEARMRNGDFGTFLIYQYKNYETKYSSQPLVWFFAWLKNLPHLGLLPH